MYIYIYFFYIDIYTFSVYFDTCFSPTLTMRYKKKKAQLHDSTQLARANHGRRMQRGGGPLARERLFDTSQEMPMKTCSPCHYEILFTSNFLLIF